MGYDDNKLDDEAEEKEEVKLEQRDVDLVAVSTQSPGHGCAEGGGLERANLVVEKPLFHSVISANVLQDIPGKFLV